MGRIERIILASTLAAMAACFALSMACKGKDDEEAPEPEGSTDEVQGEAARGEFEESDEDLLTVDYGEFYDELEPFGTWVEVNPRKIGLEVKKETALRQEPFLDRILLHSPGMHCLVHILIASVPFLFKLFKHLKIFPRPLDHISHPRQPFYFRFRKNIKRTRSIEMQPIENCCDISFSDPRIKKLLFACEDFLLSNCWVVHNI